MIKVFKKIHGGENNFFIDAKYKNLGGKKRFITSTDLYESLAFMRASNTERCILAYPKPNPPKDSIP